MHSDQEGLTEVQWEALALVFEHFSVTIRPGRSVKDWKITIMSALWLAVERQSWRQLPAQYGKWHKHYGRFQRWSRHGLHKISTRSIWCSLLECYENHEPEESGVLFDFIRWLQSEQTPPGEKEGLKSALKLLDKLARQPESRSRNSGRRPNRTTPMPHLSQYPLTDDRWHFIEIGACAGLKVGRPSENGRRCAAGLLWLVEHGEAWSKLPARFGPVQRVRRQFWRWTETGLWEILWGVLENRPLRGHSQEKWDFFGCDVAAALADPGLRAIVEGLRVFASAQSRSKKASACAPLTIYDVV
jgi:transposase